MKRMLPVLLSLILLTGCAPHPAGTYRQITMQEAVELMTGESGYVLLDVRTPQEYAERHIPGAINLPNETIGTAPLQALPDKAQTLLVYCRSGNRSKQAAEKLAALGYTNVLEFGGINQWTGETVSGTTPTADETHPLDSAASPDVS